MSDLPRLSDVEADALRQRLLEWQRADGAAVSYCQANPTQVKACFALHDRADMLKIELMRDAFRFLPTFLAAYYEDQVT